MLLQTRIPLRYIFREIAREAGFVLVIAIVADALVAFNRAYLPAVQAAIPAFLGTAISLLLSFKLNQSYDRWWEARKIWGAIVNDSRTLVRQVLSLPARKNDIARRIGLRQIAWCYSLGQSLRRLDWKQGAADLLSEDEVAEAVLHTNKPLFLVQVQARDLAEMAAAGLVTDFQRLAIDDTLTRLVDSMGRAERIKATVFPRTYGIFLNFSIYVFIGILAIALAELDPFWEILITMLIALPFLLLQKTAVQMQDPFENRPSDTAMTAIAQKIDIDLRELLGEPEASAPQPSAAAASFYLM
jgi:ion channel-forming bestrophin family protein